MTAAPKRVAVLVSGNGSNLQALLDAELGPASVVVVVSNVPTAFALERAQKAGVPTEVLAHGGYSTRDAFDAALVAVLRRHQAELVCLAGFMRLLGPTFVRAFPERILNVHPALLPAFPGMHASRQALAHGAKLAGCTVHLVDEGTDTGPIVAQAAVPVLPGDTEERLGQRIQAEEHRLYPRVVRWMAEGRVRVQGRQVEVREGAPSADSLVHPFDGRRE